MRLLLICLFVLLPAGSAAAAEQPRYVPIEQRLSAEQMAQTGLSGLSPAQLKLLNGLLDDEQTVVEKRVETATRERWPSLPDLGRAQPVHDAVKGELRGWAPGTIIELGNGQRWRVTQGELYLRKPMPSPDVTISPGLVSGWYLQVKGQSPTAKVQRLP